MSRTSSPGTAVGGVPMPSPAAVVAEIYAAFARRDVPGILAQLSPTVEWEYGVSSTDLPWLQPRRGRDAVLGFFEALRTGLEIHRFEPKTFFSAGQVVVVLADLDATVTGTGQRFVEEDEVHIWHLDAHGQVVRFRHRADTHLQWLAARGAAAPG